MSDHRMVGKIGRVSAAVVPGKVGEVMVPVRGSSEAFLARTDEHETLPVGSRVIVTEYLPPRTVVVSPVP
ncbi:MAG TPA: hypothetical protein VFL13_13415 [Candidatus Baltobacteraceae bacterium]|nr:hypothetical protein [Candidatus Baltobacteraceae bacterium]